MAEDTARALGAAAPRGVFIGGKEYFPRPLGLRDLVEVERECLLSEKKNYLTTYSENIEILNLSEKDKSTYMEKKLDEVARWTVEDLPLKTVYDTSKFPIGERTKKMLKVKMQLRGENTKDFTLAQWRKILAGGLDSRQVTEADIKKAASAVPNKQRTAYAAWWITGCIEGMLAMVYQCFKQEGLDRKTLDKHLGTDFETLTLMARTIESLSAPETGNG